MKDNIILIIKGFIIGIGKIIPGVSGSLLAIILGVYEKCINIISNVFKDFYNNILYISLIGIGIIMSVIIGSKVISYFLNINYFCTMMLFLGLIIGTLPSLTKDIKIKKKTDLIYVLIPIFFLFIIQNIQNGNIISIKNDISGYVYTFILGFIDAVTMIVPGISGTAIFIFLGAYQFVLELYGNMLNNFMIFFLFGMFLGIIIVSKIVNYFINNYKDKFYLVIFGLFVSSVFLLVINIFSKMDSTNNLIIGLILFVLGLAVSKKLDS